MFDVLVIGGGLAGSIAALTARATGARVALASRSWGATALSTGALDIAFTPALSRAHRSPNTLREHIQDIVLHRRRHPYAVMGVDRVALGVEKGFGLLSNTLRDRGWLLPDFSLDAPNRLYVSSLGALLPAATALPQHGTCPWDAYGDKRIAVVGFEGDANFDPERIVQGLVFDASSHLKAQPKFEPVVVRWRGGEGPFAMAATLDDTAQQDALGASMKSALTGMDAAFVPPVLGLDRHADAQQRISEHLSIPVFEMLGHLPSVPGARLQRALDRALEDAGVARAGDIVESHCQGDTVVSVRTADNLELRAASFVLATGRFVAGGLVGDTQVHEPLFGLPTVTELGWLEGADTEDVVAATPMESHPLMTAGVCVDARLRPIKEGHVYAKNLFAAGMILGGFASRYALCADGVALASGWHAGRLAVDAERQAA